MQPEPGCSDPTFVGSHADVAGLVGRMINEVAKAMNDGPKEAAGWLFAQEPFDKSDHFFKFEADILVRKGKVEFRVAKSALARHPGLD